MYNFFLLITCHPKECVFELTGIIRPVSAGLISSSPAKKYTGLTGCHLFSLRHSQEHSRKLARNFFSQQNSQRHMSQNFADPGEEDAQKIALFCVAAPFSLSVSERRALPATSPGRLKTTTEGKKTFSFFRKLLFFSSSAILPLPPLGAAAAAKVPFCCCRSFILDFEKFHACAGLSRAVRQWRERERERRRKKSF